MNENGFQRRECPYVGLDYYREESGAWFFGREAERGKIITNLQAARLTLLYAASGAGKSSLLHAGVAGGLRQHARQSLATPGAMVDLPVVFSAWHDEPVTGLIGAIASTIKPFLAGRPMPELPAGRLDEAIEAAADAVNANLVIILDQFEEYFLYSSRESPPERFAGELARCINRVDLPANFLISIREDAYASLGDLFKGRIANVYGNYLHMDHLDRGSAEQAIRAPLEVYNSQPGIPGQVSIQDGLVTAVLDQVPAGSANGHGDGRVATPLLQLVMETVWAQERAEGSRELRLATLQHLEGVEKIVDTHLGKALGALSQAECQTAIDMFEHLVTPSGGKIAESIPDLASRTGHSEQQVGDVLGKLDQARIVRPVPAPPGQDPVRFRRYEIFHDVLAPTINHTITAREERRRIRARVRRYAALALAVLIIAAVTAGSLLYVNERKTAESRRLAAAALVTATRDPQLSAVLALRALREYDTPEAIAALRAVLPRVDAMRVLRPGNDITAVNSAVFDPRDKSIAASAAKSGNAFIWNVTTGGILHSLIPPGGQRHNRPALAVAFSRDGALVAVGYGAGSVAVFNAATGKELRAVSLGWWVTDLAFAGNKNELVIATYGGVRLWPMKGPAAGLTTERANAIAVNPADPYEIAMATKAGTTVCSLRQGSPGLTGCEKLGGREVPSNYDVGFSGDGSEAVTADAAGNVKVYRLSDPGKVAMRLNAGDARAMSVAFSRSGDWIVAGYDSGMVRVWDRSTGLQQTQLAGDASAVNRTEFSGDGTEVITASEDGTVRVWHAQPREERTEFYSFSVRHRGPAPVYSAVYSPGGKRILILDGNGIASVFSSAGKPIFGDQPVFMYPESWPRPQVVSAAFNRAGTRIALANSDGTVDLRNAEGRDYSEVPLRTQMKADGTPRDVAFSPDGSRIVVATDTGKAEVFSSRSGERLKPLNPHSGFVLNVAVFSPDGRQILTADGNGQVEVWDGRDDHLIRSLGSLGPAVIDLQFSRSGSEFATASSDGTVTIWSADRDQAISSIDACPSPETVSFSTRGSRIVVACGDGSVPVYDTATGQLLTVLHGADAGLVNSATFSPDGNSIITTFGASGADGLATGGVRIWNSQLATTDLARLQAIAAKIRRTLSPAEIRTYVAAP